MGRSFDRNEVLRLNLLGFSDTAIAAQLGAHQTQISAWRRSANIPIRRKCWACGSVFIAPNGNGTHCGACGHRKCSRCKAIKLEYAFSVNSHTPDGINNVCKQCCAEKARPHHKRYGLRSRWDLSLEDHRSMWESQDRSCWLCREFLDYFEAHIDHDYSCSLCSGKGCRNCIRGLAHPYCNRGIGLFKESPEKLRAAAEALELYFERKRAGRSGRGISSPARPDSACR